MGKAARRKWEARLAALAASMASTSNKPTGKPIDRWLGLASVAAGIMFGLTDKTPTSIIIWLLIIFALLVHPVWNFWWLEKSRIRQISALIVFAIVLVVFGYKQLPGPVVLADEQLCANALAFAQRLRDFDHERHIQLAESERQIMARINQAMTEEERLKISEEKSLAYSRWFDNFNYDLGERYIPQGLYLRDQLLIRLPQQPVATVINDDATFRNIGPNAMFAAANRLDVLAHKLCPLAETKESSEKK